jgi:RNA polymerase sigma factor (sigma-70 family)
MARQGEVQRWMSQLADGDRAAFAPLYAELWPALQRFCRRALGRDADGDDAAQQALCNVLSRAHEFDPTRDATAWAFGIAAWECRTWLRRRGRRRETSIDEAAASAETETQMIQRDLLAAATETISTLRREDLAIIVAAIDGDPDGRAGLAPATYRKRLERAFGRLRAAWRARHGDV